MGIPRKTMEHEERAKKKQKPKPPMNRGSYILSLKGKGKCRGEQVFLQEENGVVMAWEQKFISTLVVFEISENLQTVAGGARLREDMKEITE